MSEHGPTPWMVNQYDGLLRDADGDIIADATDFGESVYISTDNRDFIVRACNVHDELVAALIEARRIIAGYIGLPVEQCTGGEFGQINAAIIKATAP